MRFRASISLVRYRHSELIEALENIAVGERASFLCDLASEAIKARTHHNQSASHSTSTPQVSKTINNASSFIAPDVADSSAEARHIPRTKLARAFAMPNLSKTP